MAKLVILLACVAALQAVSALECYSCDSETCKNEMKTWDKLKCGGSADDKLEPACLKFTYKGKDGKEIVSRRCSTAPKSGEATCPTPPQDGTDPKCSVCKTDLCNSASSVSFSFATFVSVLLAFLGQKYLL